MDHLDRLKNAMSSEALHNDDKIAKQSVDKLMKEYELTEQELDTQMMIDMVVHSFTMVTFPYNPTKSIHKKLEIGQRPIDMRKFLKNKEIKKIFNALKKMMFDIQIQLVYWDDTSKCEIDLTSSPPRFHLTHYNPEYGGILTYDELMEIHKKLS